MRGATNTDNNDNTHANDNDNDNTHTNNDSDHDYATADHYTISASNQHSGPVRGMSGPPVLLLLERRL